MKNIRYYIFWTLDFLKGSPVRKHYKEIKNAFYDKSATLKIQEQRLSDILQYAINNTSYYRNCSPEHLQSFPVITKQQIVKNIDSVFSKEFFTEKNSLKTMTTSGSNGTPFRVYQNQDKVRRNRADLLFFYEIGGYDLGDRFYFMRVWNKLNRKSKRAQIKENLKMFDTANLDVEGAQTFVNTLIKDTKPKVVLAYASSFTSLLQHIEPGEYNWNIKAIFTGAEELIKETKKKMLDTFNCPVMSRYSNQENGVLAQQPITGEDYFRLNEGSYYFEFLKLESTDAAEEGETARIVITDLFNKAIPMIRYDTGDVGTYKFAANGKRVLTEIIGRKTDFLLNCDGKVLSPFVITNLMWEFNGIAQFQFIQETLTDFKLKIVYSDVSKHVFYLQKLTKDLKRIFGQEATINIIKVDSIPLEASGKRRYIISKLKTQHGLN